MSCSTDAALSKSARVRMEQQALKLDAAQAELAWLKVRFERSPEIAPSEAEVKLFCRWVAKKAAALGYKKPRR